MNVNFIIFLVSTLAIVAIALAVTLWGRRDARRRRESMGRLCTGETVGTVTEVIESKPGSPAAVKVAYEVDGETYHLREQITATATGSLGGRAALGFVKSPVLDIAHVGDTVTVHYNPENPKLAHLPGNDGLMKG